MRYKFIKKPRFFLPIIGILIFLIVVIAIIRNMNQPAVGSINQTPPTQAIKTDPYAQPGTFKGRYVSFTYPAHFKSVPSKLAGSNLEAVEYHSTDAEGKLINIAVYPGSISNESGVTYRRQHPELYTESSSQKWIEFTKKDGTEDTFFIPHNNLLAVVSATTPYSNQNSDALFVASSLKWL